MEFNLRVQEFIELCRANKKEEAIDYSKKHFKTYLDTSKKDSLQGSIRRHDSIKLKTRSDPLLAQFLQMMGTLAFPPNTTCPPYKVHRSSDFNIFLFLSDQ